MIKAILVIANVAINIPILIRNGTMMDYAVAFYSLWGTASALFSHISSIIACHYESWFKFAYIVTEMSYAINLVVVIIFWSILWPMFMSQV